MLNQIYSPLGRLIANGEAYKILRVDKNQLIAETLEGEPQQECFHEHQIKRLLASGELEYHPFALANRTKQETNSNNEVVPSDLSEVVREQVEWRLAWCHAFLDLEANNALKRTDFCIKANLETMHQHALQRLVANCGEVALQNTFHPPCPRTLRGWVKSYRGNPGGIASLIPKHKSKPKNMSVQISPEAEELLSSCIQLYLSRQKPSQTMIVQATISRFNELNTERIEGGQPPIQIPSASTIKRRIREIEPYFKCLHREGPSIANRKFALYENGISAKFPGEIIQIDSWRVDLITLFGNSEQMSKLDQTQKKEIEKGRRWIILAIDSATRVILGFRIAETPDANTSVALLEDIMRDKSDLAEATGCKHSWSQKTGLGTILTDSGSEFANSKFEGAVAEFMGDGLPYLSSPTVLLEPAG